MPRQTIRLLPSCLLLVITTKQTIAHAGKPKSRWTSLHAHCNTLRRPFSDSSGWSCRSAGCAAAAASPEVTRQTAGASAYRPQKIRALLTGTTYAHYLYGHQVLLNLN